jgi:hypothetical protein
VSQTPDATSSEEISATNSSPNKTSPDDGNSISPCPTASKRGIDEVSHFATTHARKHIKIKQWKGATISNRQSLSRTASPFIEMIEQIAHQSDCITIYGDKQGS